MTNLPENIDSTYPDRSDGDAAHQQHHDTIHGVVNTATSDADDGLLARDGAGGIESVGRDTYVALESVVAHGATGDGSTDDTTAIQSAIDAANTAGGGIVWFPLGDYAFTRLTIKSDVSLWGVGRNASFLLCTDSSSGSALVSADDGNRVSRFGMQNIGVGTAKSSVSAAQDSNQDVIGINLAACEGGHFTNVKIAGFGSGAIVLARAEAGAEGLGFTSTTQDGNYNSFDSIHIASCGKYNADEAAVWFKYKANSNKLNAIYIKGGVTNGVVFAHGNDNLVSGLTVESATNGVYFKDLASNNTVVQMRGEGLSGAIIKADAPDTSQENQVVGVHQSSATMLDLAAGALVRLFAAGVNRLPGPVELTESGDGVSLVSDDGTSHTFTSDDDGSLASGTAGSVTNPRMQRVVNDLNTLAAWDDLRGDDDPLGSTPDEHDRSWTMATAGSFSRTANGAEADTSSTRVAVIDLGSIAGPGISGWKYVEVSARVGKRVASGNVGVVLGYTDANNYLFAIMDNGGVSLRKVVGGTSSTITSKSLSTPSSLTQAGRITASLTVDDGDVMHVQVHARGVTLEYDTDDAGELSALTGSNVGILASLTFSYVADFVARKVQ